MKKFNYLEVTERFNTFDFQDLIHYLVAYRQEVLEKRIKPTYTGFEKKLYKMVEDEIRAEQVAVRQDTKLLITRIENEVEFKEEQMARVKRLLMMNFILHYFDVGNEIPVELAGESVTIPVNISKVDKFNNSTKFINHIDELLTITDLKIIVLEEVNDPKHKDTLEQLKALSQRQKTVNSSILVFPVVNEKGKAMNDYRNVECMLSHKNIELKFNDIKKEIEFTGDLKGLTLDNAVTEIHSYFNDYLAPISPDYIGRSINRIGQKYNYNPVTEMLLSAKENWDGKVGRIKLLCDTLITDDFDEDLKLLLIKTWLFGTSRIAFNTLDNRYNTEGILVLQGKQGMGKTRWSRKLAPIEVKDYVMTDKSIDPKNKDSVYETIAYWIVELGELDSTMKSEQADLKSFFNRSIDEMRLPYDKSKSKFPRTTSYIGTVNKSQFLKDDTGNRRYWILPTKGIDHELMETIDIKQLWGEVMHLPSVEPNIKHYLTSEQLEKLNSNNDGYRIENKIQSIINSSFAWDMPRDKWKHTSQSYIVDRLNIKTTDGLAEAIENICGSQKAKKRCFYISKPMWGYLLPPFIHKGENI